MKIALRDSEFSIVIMATLERAIAIAATAHAGQLDKNGMPYILHPLRVMMRVEAFDAKIIAVLHDLIEDTEWTPDQLRSEGFSAVILEALDCVTRRETETYEEFVERSSSNALARSVKLADLEDNMNMLRLKEVTAKDLERLERYHRAWRRLHDRA